MSDQIQTTSLRQAPRHITDHISPMGGFAINHQINFKVMDRDIATLASQLDRWLQDQRFTVMGKAVRAIVETHPRRRRVCAQWYSLRRELEGLRPCLRGLAFYTKDWVEILRVHAKDGGPRVTADETALARMGLWLDEDTMLRETIKGEGTADNCEDVATGNKIGASGTTINGKGKKKKKARGGKGSGEAAMPEKRKAEQMVEELEKEQNEGEGE